MINVGVFFFSSGGGGNTIALIIGLTVGTAGVLLLGLIAYVIWKRKAAKRGKIEKKGK